MDRLLIDRRHLIAAGAVGGGLLGLAGNAGALQIEGTPPAMPGAADVLPAEDPIADLAQRLDYDADAIFAFVRDEIHFESYAGVLRGAKGTLWSRAGNAADQSVLLAELLTAAQIPYRFATGPLDQERLDALTVQLTPTAVDANGLYRKAIEAALLELTGLDQLPATPEPLPAEEQQLFDDTLPLVNAALERARQSADVSRSAIANSLAASGIELPPLPIPALASREQQSHCWIQVADGPEWIDLDPTVEAETTISPVATFDTLPGDWYHSVVIRISAEELFSGTLGSRDVVTLTTTSDRLVNTPIALNIAPAEAIAGLGSSLNQLFTGQLTLVPSLYVDGTSVDATQPLVFATDGASAIGALDSGTPVVGGGEGETVGVWLIVDIASPDAAPVTIERAILDRVPVADRASGVIDPAAISPLSTAPSAFAADELDTVDEFNALVVVTVDVARVPLIHAQARAAVDPVLGVIGVFGPSLAALRDSLGVAHETEAGVWSYPSGPNVTAFTFRTASEEPGNVAVDIMHRMRTSHPLADATSGDVHPLVLSGILDAIAEQTVVSPEITSNTEATADVMPAIGAIFEEANATNVGFAVLRSTADLATVELDERSIALITKALDLGLVVIVPEQPIEVNGDPTIAWWIVDPVTGRTTDQMGNGQGSASTDAPLSRTEPRKGDTLPFYARWLEWLKANAKILNCLGTIIGGITGIAVIVLNFTGPQSQALYAVGIASGVGNVVKIPNACF